MAQPCDMDLWVMKWRSAWPIFHDPVILPYILKTIWCMNFLVWDNESVWHDIWPPNKCRSLWPIFHGPVILPYLLKTIWRMNIIIWDYGSVWPKVWCQNKGHCDLNFMVQWFWHILNVGLCDLYLFHGPVILTYISQDFLMHEYHIFCNPNFDLKVNMSTWPIFHGLVSLLNIFKIIWWMNTIAGIMDQCDT